jgi:predicted nucleic acid-binding protein
MLYLDTSALVKRYFNEVGHRSVVARFESGEEIFTSRLTYGEVHSVIGRKFRSEEFGLARLVQLREGFLNDWLFSLSILEVDGRTMTQLPELVERYPLKAGAAIQLSAAFWLKDAIRLGKYRDHAQATVEFGVTDRDLAKAALNCGFKIFNPEEDR